MERVFLRQHRAVGASKLAARKNAGTGAYSWLRRKCREQASWTFSSDVCKHCERAGCLEACPTGSIVRTEFGEFLSSPMFAMVVVIVSSHVRLV